MTFSLALFMWLCDLWLLICYGFGYGFASAIATSLSTVLAFDLDLGLAIVLDCEFRYGSTSCDLLLHSVNVWLSGGIMALIMVLAFDLVMFFVCGFRYCSVIYVTHSFTVLVCCGTVCSGFDYGFHFQFGNGLDFLVHSMWLFGFASGFHVTVWRLMRYLCNMMRKNW